MKKESNREEHLSTQFPTKEGLTYLESMDKFYRNKRNQRIHAT